MIFRTGSALGTTLAPTAAGAFRPGPVLGHGGIGIVEAVVSMVKRVQVGDAVMSEYRASAESATTVCGDAADHCLLNGAPLLPYAELRGGIA